MGIMSVWRKLFRSDSNPSTTTRSKPLQPPPSTAPSKPRPSSTAKIQDSGPTKTTATSYVESVFAFDLAETSDPRDWQELGELKDVPNLFYDNKIPQVETKLNAALIKFPDYDFVYNWQASVAKKKGEIEQARQAYAEGIRVSKQKHYLCSRFALLEFEHGTLKEAVRWWIRDILLQMQAKSVDDAMSFQYLACVASFTSQNDASSKLRAAAAKDPRFGSMVLTHEREQDVSRKVNAEWPCDEIRLAIQELTTERWGRF